MASVRSGDGGVGEGAGVIEAKRKGEALTRVEIQTAKYSDRVPGHSDSLCRPQRLTDSSGSRPRKSTHTVWSSLKKISRPTLPEDD